MAELTPRQASILKFIELFIARNQQPPAEREIAAHFRIHQSAVRKHLNALDRKGHLEMRRDGRSRGIRLRGVNTAVPVPVIEPDAEGIIAAAGIPAGSLMLDADLVGTEEAFLLRMVGEAMIDAGIADGDLLLVRKIEQVRNGEVIVARLKDELIVRRFFEIAGRVVLEPANRRFRPISIRDPSVYQIVGRVATLLRSLTGMSIRRATVPTEESKAEVKG